MTRHFFGGTSSSCVARYALLNMTVFSLLILDINFNIIVKLIIYSRSVIYYSVVIIPTKKSNCDKLYTGIATAQWQSSIPLTAYAKPADIDSNK